MTEREKYIRSIEFRGNGEIISGVSISYPVWEQYQKFFENIKKECPDIGIWTGKDENRKSGNKIRDAWGCLWIYPLKYLDGQVIEHPLSNWSFLKNYQAPLAENFIDWQQSEKDILKLRKEGKFTSGGVGHGFVFLTLTYLRGFENFMIDVAENNNHLPALISLVENYWMEVVKRWINIGVDSIGFGDDLGLQKSLPLSPQAWRTYIKPTYKKIFSYCRKHNVYVYLHTDGYILDIIPDLIECGVSVLNPQDIVNGVDNLKQLAWGKTAIDLDIDRQYITFRGSPNEVDEHILNCIKILGSENGGLWLKFGAYPGTPIENIAAVIHAMEKYRNYWVGR